MKRYLFVIAMLMITVWSCENKIDNGQEVTPVEEEFVTLPISVTGEILTMTDMPLTKSDDNRAIYLIQVYTALENDSYDWDTEDGLSPYAYGVFTDLSKASIKLNPNLTYHFVASCFKDLLEPDGLEITNIGCIVTKTQSNAFDLMGSLRLDEIDINMFIYNSEYFTVPFVDFYGWAGTKDEGIKRGFDFYYSEIAGFKPSQNSSVLFDMRRCVFGYRFEVDNLDKMGGSISVEVNPVFASSDYGNFVIKLTSSKPFSESTTPFLKSRTPFPIPSGPERFIWRSYVNNINTEYSEEVPLKITHITNDGAENVIYNGMITFTRNMKKLVSIHLEEAESVAAPMGVTFEAAEMIDDEPLIIGR